MIQQKQQGYSKVKPQRATDSVGVGQLFRKLLNPIQTTQKSPSRSEKILQKYLSPKKIKMRDIFYEQQPQQKVAKSRQKPFVSSRNLLPSVIIEKETISDRSSIEKNQEKEETVIKNLYRDKNNQEEGLCEFHRNKIKNELQNADSSEKRFFHLRVRDCCQTEPTQQPSKDQRVNLLMHRYHHQSLQKNVLHPLPRTPQHQKPFKFNNYQKSQLFDTKISKYFSSVKSPNHKDLLSKKQQKAMIQKLFKPKCTENCGKKNCQCYRYSKLSRQMSPKERQSSLERQITNKKININLVRLQKLHNAPNPENDKILDIQNIRRKIKQRKEEKRNNRRIGLERYHTESIMSESFLKESTQTQKEPQNQLAEPGSSMLISSRKMQSDEQSFIKGIKPSAQTTIQNAKNTARNGRHTQRKLELIENNEKTQHQRLKKIQISIQTQDILIVREEEAYDPPQNNQKVFAQNNEVETIQQNNEESVQNCNQNQTNQKRNDQFSFGQRGNSFLMQIKMDERTDETKNQKVCDSNQKKKAKLGHHTQYWLHYDVQKKFINLLIKQNLEQKPGKSINLKSQVVNQMIFIQQKQAQNKKEETVQKRETQLKLSQISDKFNIQKVADLPINNLKLNASTVQCMSPLGSRLRVSNRNCISSNSGIKHLNMFNIGTKSNTSSRIKRTFKLPRKEESAKFILEYKPIYEKIVIENLAKEENFRVFHELTRFYFGQIIGESVKHGLGVEMTATQVFEGEFVDGKRKHGVLIQGDGHYEGPFENNLRHGKGTYKWNNGQFYDGDWRLGTRNGYGVWAAPDGSKYEGEWQLSMQHGKGKHVYSISTYEGTFVHCMKDGHGKETFVNGDIYIGEYRGGKANGKGKYQWKDGTYYQGDFVDGLRQGFGKWHQSPQNLYEGQFRNDQKHGKGSEFYKDGSYLEGQFKHGQIVRGTLFNIQKQVIRQINEAQKVQQKSG